MKKSRLSNIFPNTSVQAYYDQVHQLICLAKYNTDEFKDIDFSRITMENMEKLSLFEHELTHWLDHYSTLWGQQNIVLLFNAINSHFNGNIEDFWRIKHLDNTFRKDSFFDYYTEKYNHIIGDENYKWRYRITSGVRFSSSGEAEHNKPLLFVRFNSFNDKPIARVPISVASILETNAINAEYRIKFEALEKIDNVLEKKIQEKRLHKELVQLLYHPDLTLYSVLAHLTANLNNQPDIIWTYNVTSLLGTMILNLPAELYSSIKTPAIGDETWKSRYGNFMVEKDKGCAFYFITNNLIDAHGQRNFSIENALSASNLPTESELETTIEAEMLNNLNELIDGPFKLMAQEIITNGIDLFKKRGVFGNKNGFREYIVNKKFYPTIIFGDTVLKTDDVDLYEVIDKIIKNEKLSTEEKYSVFDYAENKFEEFVKICGV